jgi:lipopolysaccharide cholinephosphotransferase
MNTINDLQQLHDHLYRMLEEIADFFEQHDIDYSLFAGTLLGAVRHKGFIPWDDDIDLFMTEDEFKKFLGVAHLLPSYFKIQSQETDPDYELEFPKIRDERTVVLEKGKENRTYKYRGLFIDIFVFRGYTEEGSELCGRVDRLRKFVTRLNRLRRGSLKRRLAPPVKILARAQLNRLNKQLEARYRTHDFSKTAQMSLHENNFCPFFKKSEVFPTERKYTFNGKLFRGPKNPDSVLRPLYGEYMVIPDEKDRPKAHVTEFYFKEGYEPK